MTARDGLRVGLTVLTATQLLVGVWALPAPRAFYGTFPAAGHAWVALFPPYNEHLVRDVGAQSLALAVVLGAAAVTVDRLLARVGLTATLVYALPHAVFHGAHLDSFPTADAVAQTVGTGLHLLLIFGLLALTWVIPVQRRTDVP